MKYLLRLLVLAFIFTAMSSSAHAAKPIKAKVKSVAAPTMEKLVLMPLRVPEQDSSLEGAMETALVEGLQQKYEVLSGEQVAKKAREIFLKESHNTAHAECDETRCLQGIAEAFQSELLAIVSIAKREDGYFLALSIKNIFDNLAVYSKSTPCKNCDAYQVVEKLKELGGASAQAILQQEVLTATPLVDTQIQATPATTQSNAVTNPEIALWQEVEKGNAEDDYEAYLAQYPKGKFIALAKNRLKKLKDLAAAALAQQDQKAWEFTTNDATEASYQSYLNSWPSGRYTSLAQARIKTLQEQKASMMLGEWAVDFTSKNHYTGLLSVYEKSGINLYTGSLELTWTSNSTVKRVRQKASITLDGNKVTIVCSDPVMIEGTSSYNADRFYLSIANQNLIKGTSKDEAGGGIADITLTKK